MNNSINHNQTLLVDNILSNNFKKDYNKELNFVITSCSLILWINFFTIVMIQAKKSAKTGLRTKEDLGNNFDKNRVTLEKKADELRWWNIELNELETVIFGLIVFWGAKVTVKSSLNNFYLCIFIIVFTIARIFHTIAYGNNKVFLRIAFYALSFISIVTVGVISCLESF